MATASTSLIPLTGNILVDASTNGTRWILDQSRIVTWALANFGPYVWNQPAETAAAIGQAFTTYEAFANIKFSYVGLYSAPGIAPANSVISLDGIGNLFSNSSTWAKGFFPNIDLTQSLLPASIRGSYLSAPGDIWLNITSALNTQPTYQPGSIGFAVIIHEIGHTLGLKHPHDDGLTGHPTFTAVGERGLDVDWATVMSYNESNPLSVSYWHPATPMILDVIAMQSLYGPNLANNAGNDTHRLVANNQYQTIFDPSGTDTVDASGSIFGWSVNLGIGPANANHPYNIGVAEAMDGIAQPTSMYWLYGQIEKVIGSSHADKITGSNQSESILAGGGNDLVNGAGGNDGFFGLSGQDAIFGGDGIDTIIAGIASTDAILGKMRGDAFILEDRAGNITLARNVETIMFTDRTVSLAAVTPIFNLDSALTQIYVAAFRRAPETGGYNYWLQQETATDLKRVADTIFSLDIVKVLYPTAMSSTQFVSAIYQNVFNRAPDAEGLNYWINQLSNTSRGKLVIDMTSAALSVPDGTSGKDYFQNRLDWSLYAVAYQTIEKQEMTPSHLTILTNTVTGDPFTVLTLIGQAEAGMII